MDIVEKQTEETVTTSGTVSPEHIVRTTHVVDPAVGTEAAHTEETVTTSSTVAPQQVVRTTKVVAPPVIPVEHPAKVFKKKKTIFRTYQIIWYILVFIEVLLAFRVALKAMGANPLSGFATLVYALSNPFALPFSGLFGSSVTQQGSVFEWSTIIAAAVYALIAVGIVHIIHLTKPVSTAEVEHAVDEV